MQANQELSNGTVPNKDKELSIDVKSPVELEKKESSSESKFSFFNRTPDPV